VSERIAVAFRIAFRGARARRLAAIVARAVQWRMADGRRDGMEHAHAHRVDRRLLERTPPRKRLMPRVGAALVLLVEDDEEMRRMLAAVLRRDGLRVAEAADGDAAMAWLAPWALEGKREAAPDLIVSDIRLPFFSGLEILEGVQIAGERVPVILITGFPDDETIERARELGAACLLAKPFDIADFKRAVRLVLRPE
jgi:CheY-like chemotaxis protein